ncbi:helix-turn-helix domain-containing protein [Ruminococcus champanellensis]|uniref:helix-turn-helix domain-containing protein n=1 Tax=Ruminococcus champanellensis TaxID=1161942 RepID=UPI0023F1B81F|nr:helix-turn-helix transcriptional regulator [Ruminococcus champanellensis]
MKYDERLKTLREERNIKQQVIADILQTSQSYYAQYENGKRQIPFDRAIILAEFYNVSLDYIAGFTNEKRPLYRKK